MYWLVTTAPPVAIGGRHAILRGIFGSIDADVMRYAETTAATSTLKLDSTNKICAAAALAFFGS